ncbi:carboxymuconolactone decarboxylase family protein [Bradyrhizobium sp. U87765 SZCCT0131]|uniref:carboxymuconolactone decarboxylase family protein n=1 Tax=unclassified Bradyrhizobium TaxID=2631580 RepID=UPI001BAA234B|nr:MULTISPECIES: carboxymuconolactone decarboxylase family protein [unclassified Bradyrhizobium]MBR1217739.1 carboxymuconolactone decarboxylase family protein [Bradyrhizobium sp. U87765 SZCCT0131]MBR1261315.1 carboxymuconolactone decarboxylase family protein [Bradyrhizobium sp. U87765 SZCCT0134]MBR1303237.1 carboxymuconolactone decarboxylase family protein [Bradyrhizobium sp. U87765 SZCCT0110]MBR1318843.1 carboxymuconolactone decarboxylase family protein [Bradyrhizobium sp. U87765 SZCCT0109]MB
MARVPLRRRDDLPDHLRPLWDRMTVYGGAFEGQAGAMANRLPIFEHTWRLLTELAEENVLPKRYLELAIVAVSLVNQCTFCVAQHAPKLAVEGITPEGAAQLLDWEKHPELDAVDRLVVEYAIAVTSNWHRIRDAMFERLRAHFSDAQIVELTWRTALCGAFNRFNDVLQVEVDV